MAALGNTPMDRGGSLAAENPRRAVDGASPKDADCVGGNGAVAVDAKVVACCGYTCRFSLGLSFFRSTG